MRGADRHAAYRQPTERDVEIAVQRAQRRQVNRRRAPYSTNRRQVRVEVERAERELRRDVGADAADVAAQLAGAGDRVERKAGLAQRDRRSVDIEQAGELEPAEAGTGGIQWFARRGEKRAQRGHLKRECAARDRRLLRRNRAGEIELGVARGGRDGHGRWSAGEQRPRICETQREADLLVAPAQRRLRIHRLR